MLLQRLRKVAVCMTAALIGLATAQAAPLDQIDTAPQTVSVANNSGGSIISFAFDAAKYRSSGTQVHFTGRCDSACTLFLGLPKSQTCVSSGAYFRFHAPFGVSARAQQLAQNYMMRKYPRWVQSWINSNRGLTRDLITMDYSYASRFMRTCNSVASR
jgi:hypothetical protein